MKFATPFFLSLSLAVVSCNQNIKEAPPAKPLPPGVEETYSGLKDKLLRPGKGGPTPNSLCTVKVHYEGKTKDGKVFDNSYKRCEQAELPLDQVIQGWTEEVQLMTLGEVRQFWIPAKLAYGHHANGLMAGGDLILDIGLVDLLQ